MEYDIKKVARHRWPEAQDLGDGTWRRVWHLGLEVPEDRAPAEVVADLEARVSTADTTVELRIDDQATYVVVTSRLHPGDEVAYLDTMEFIRLLGDRGVTVLTVEGEAYESWALLRRPADSAS